ncbi:MAG TPA: nuclear transport factor 2 family protein [Acidimicrobiales bacterium]
MDRDLQERRLATVREHMDAENRLDFDTVIATFARPRYELMASGRVFDGEDDVRGYFAQSRRVFPDQRNENAVLHATHDGAVVAEFDLLGTHRDTGRAFRSRMVAFFFFDEGGDRITCERVYFDRASIDEQTREPQRD